MSDGRVALIVARPQGNRGVVVFASRDAAYRWREVAEDKGVETFGCVEVVSRVDALLDIHVEAES